MAFQTKNLSVLAYANGFTLWHYTTDDGFSAVSMDGYFHEASEMLRVGDMLLVNARQNEQPAGSVLLVSYVDDDAVSVTQISFGSPA